ncbi:MAG: hypothetical protein WCI72_06670 [archaeon]
MFNKFIFGFLLVITLSLVAAQIGNTDVSFTTSSGDYICMNSNYEAFWMSVSSGTVINIINATYNSKGVCNDTQYSEDWCCPRNSQCVNGECIAYNSSYNGDVCSALSDPSTCNTASASFALSLMDLFSEEYNNTCGSSSSYLGYSVGNEICANITTCSCAWDSSKEACGLNVAQEAICGANIVSSTKCSWVENSTKTQNLCDTENKLVIIYDAVGEFTKNGNDLCKEQRVEYPCTISVQLPFFDKFSFIFAALAIVGIYFIMNRGKNVK